VIKLIFSILFLGTMSISHEVSAMQVLQSNKKPSTGQRVSNAVGVALYGFNPRHQQNQDDRNDFNRREEQQQLLREQVRLQQEALNMQRHHNYFGN
jgi:hypothetical protein